MTLKIVCAFVLVVAFFYRVVRDSNMVIKQLVVTTGELLYYEALNRRVLLSLIPWIAALIYWQSPILIAGIILYEIGVYIVILSLSYMVYRFYYETGNQTKK